MIEPLFILNVQSDSPISKSAKAVEQAKNKMGLNPFGSSLSGSTPQNEVQKVGGIIASALFDALWLCLPPLQPLEKRGEKNCRNLV